MDSKKKIYVLWAWNYATDKTEVFYTLSYKKALRKYKEHDANEDIGAHSLVDFDLF
jgi:hypothetical protein